MFAAVYIFEPFNAVFSSDLWINLINPTVDFIGQKLRKIKKNYLL